MKSDHDEAIAAWFATSRPLPEAGFTQAVMARVKMSQRRFRICVAASAVSLLAVGGWLWPVLAPIGSAAVRLTFDGLVISGAALASPIAWLLGSIVCAAMWTVIRVQQ